MVLETFHPSPMNKRYKYLKDEINKVDTNGKKKKRKQKRKRRKRRKKKRKKENKRKKKTRKTK